MSILQQLKSLNPFYLDPKLSIYEEYHSAFGHAKASESAMTTFKCLEVLNLTEKEMRNYFIDTRLSKRKACHLARVFSQGLASSKELKSSMEKAQQALLDLELKRRQMKE